MISDTFVIKNEALSAMCDATAIIDYIEPHVGSIGRQILLSAKQHLEQSLRDYLTKGKGELWF